MRMRDVACAWTMGNGFSGNRPAQIVQARMSFRRAGRDVMAVHWASRVESITPIISANVRVPTRSGRAVRSLDRQALHAGEGSKNMGFAEVEQATVGQDEETHDVSCPRGKYEQRHPIVRNLDVGRRAAVLQPGGDAVASRETQLTVA